MSRTQELPYSSPSAADVSSVFPLPCTAFEKYMLHDDTHSHPMVSDLEVDLSGPVDLDRLRETLPTILARHPLMNAHAKKTGSRFTHWVQGNVIPEIELLAESADAIPPEPMDLMNAGGLRILFRPGSPTSMLSLRVHHGVCDALSMLTFVVEWLALANGMENRLPPASVLALRHREDIEKAQPSFSRWERFRNSMRYLFETPAPLPSQLKPDPESIPGPSVYCSLPFEPESLAKLKSRAKEEGVSINDWLATSLLQAVAQWDLKHVPAAVRHKYRLVIPVNRREADEFFLSSCNKISFTMLSRRYSQTKSFEELLANISAEMAPVRHHPQGVHSFLKAMRMLSNYYVLELLLKTYNCFATLVLSNLGSVSRYFSPILDVEDDRLRAGEVVIEGIRCAPPRRRNTRMAIVAHTYAGQLHVMTSRAGRGLDEHESEEFLRMFQQSLLNSLT